MSDSEINLDRSSGWGNARAQGRPGHEGDSKVQRLQRTQIPAGYREGLRAGAQTQKLNRVQVENIEVPIDELVRRPMIDILRSLGVKSLTPTESVNDFQKESDDEDYRISAFLVKPEYSDHGIREIAIYSHSNKKNFDDFKKYHSERIAQSTVYDMPKQELISLMNDFFKFIRDKGISLNMLKGIEGHSKTEILNFNDDQENIHEGISISHIKREDQDGQSFDIRMPGMAESLTVNFNQDQVKVTIPYYDKLDRELNLSIDDFDHNPLKDILL